jgi:ankyrin repeat protein
MKILLKTDKDGKTCLHHAAYHGNLDVVSFLVDEGGNDLLSKRCKVGLSCLHSACFSGSLDIVQFLMAKDTLLKSIQELAICLYVACERGGLDIASWIIEDSTRKGVSKQIVLGTYENNRTCLHAACRHESLGLVRQLLKAGGDELLHAADANGYTCLMSACSVGHLEIVKYLTRKGGESLLLRTTCHGASCLHLAVTVHANQGDDAVTQFLIHCRPVQRENVLAVIKYLAGIPCAALRCIRLNGDRSYGSAAGATALELAMSSGDLEACSALT